MKRRSLLVSAALCAVLAGTAYAQGLGGRLGGWHAPQVQRISGLSVEQQAAFEQLRQRQQAFRVAAHEEVGALLTQAQAELAQPDADLRALNAETSRTLAALAIEANGLRQARLGFYESLDAEQQAQARAFLQQRLSRLQRMHALIGDFLADAQ